MKKTILLIAVTILLIVGALYTVSAYNKSNTESQGVAEVKENAEAQGSSNSTAKIGPFQGSKVKVKAPDFKLKDLQGKEIGLEDLKGKNVFVNFWATWCPPCKAEMPDIEKLYQETRASDLVIVAVDIGEDMDTVKSFVDKNKYNFTVLLDINKEAALKYNISSIPSSFFIDKEGYIRASHVGAMNLAQMKSYVQLLDK